LSIGNLPLSIKQQERKADDLERILLFLFTQRLGEIAHEVSAFANREANTGKPRAQIWNPQKQNMANSAGMNW
jgi:hypothetical protein